MTSLQLIAGIFQAVPDAFESVWNFFYAGKLFMVFLLALSVLAITVIIYKALDLRRHLVLPEEAVDAIESAPAAMAPREAGDIARRLRASDSALGRLGVVALSGDHGEREDASRAVEARAKEEVVGLETGIALLEVVITIAPLLGLLGTVSGLVGVFSNLGDSADYSAIAMGIAEALSTTIAGLAIAVPTVIAHSYFIKKIEKMGVRMEVLLGGLLASVYREGSPPEPRPVERQELPPVAEIAEEPPAAEPEPQIHMAVPDPGASTYPAPQPPVAPEPAAPPAPDPIPQPVPEPPAEPGIPRLLAGHQPQAPEGTPIPTPAEYEPEEQAADQQQPSA